MVVARQDPNKAQGYPVADEEGNATTSYHPPIRDGQGAKISRFQATNQDFKEQGQFRVFVGPTTTYFSGVITTTKNCCKDHLGIGCTRPKCNKFHFAPGRVASNLPGRPHVLLGRLHSSLRNDRALATLLEWSVDEKANMKRQLLEFEENLKRQMEKEEEEFDEEEATRQRIAALRAGKDAHETKMARESAKRRRLLESPQPEQPLLQYAPQYMPRNDLGDYDLRSDQSASSSSYGNLSMHSGSSHSAISPTLSYSDGSQWRPGYKLAGSDTAADGLSRTPSPRDIRAGEGTHLPVLPPELIMRTESANYPRPPQEVMQARQYMSDQERMNRDRLVSYPYLTRDQRIAQDEQAYVQRISNPDAYAAYLLACNTAATGTHGGQLPRRLAGVCRSNLSETIAQPPVYAPGAPTGQTLLTAPEDEAYDAAHAANAPDGQPFPPPPAEEDDASA